MMIDDDGVSYPVWRSVRGQSTNIQYHTTVCVSLTLLTVWQQQSAAAEERSGEKKEQVMMNEEGRARKGATVWYCTVILPLDKYCRRGVLRWVC